MDGCQIIVKNTISHSVNNQFNNTVDFVLLAWPFSVSMEITFMVKFIKIENLHLCGYRDILMNLKCIIII